MPTSVHAPRPTPEDRAGARVLVAWFSRPGQNYADGGRVHLEVGNTEVLATTIAGMTSAATYRIEAADPYPDDYDETVARHGREVAEDARPALVTPPPSMEGIDVVLLGSPVWVMQEPMIMRTFLEASHLLAGRTIHPFVTHAMSGMGRVAQDYAQICPDATIGQGLAVRGEEVADCRDEVGNWLRAIGLLA